MHIPSLKGSISVAAMAWPMSQRHPMAVMSVYSLAFRVSAGALHTPAGRSHGSVNDCLLKYITSCTSNVIALLNKVTSGLTFIVEQEVLVVHRPCKTRYRL